MTQEQLEDISYQIATSNFTQAELGFKEYSELDEEGLMAISWQPFEDYNPGEYGDLIEKLANDIQDKFKQFVTK